MIARVPIFPIILCSLLIVALPDSLTIAGIPLRVLLGAMFCAWRYWLYCHIKKPRCEAARQQQMLDFINAGLQLAQSEQQRDILLQWVEVNTRRKRTRQPQQLTGD